MLFVLTAAAFLLLGWGIALRIWNDDPAENVGVLERLLAAATVAFGVWLAIDWVLALTHVFTHAVLIVRTVVVFLVGVTLVASRRGFLRVDVPRISLIALAPVTLWVVFVGWRATIIPPLSHDALSNHLPRAVLYSRMKGFFDLTLLSHAFKDLPANYELLLADMISMSRHDQYTEWLSTLCYLVLVLAGGTLASRWWGDTRVTVLSTVALACAPIVLLQSGADKNDLMVGAFTIAALVWGGRHWRTGEFASALLLATSLLIAVGTKPQAAAVGAALLPLVIWRVVCDVRALRISLQRVFAAILFGAVAFVLLGGYTYFDQYLRRAGLVVPTFALPPVSPTRVMAYGDWSNLWQGPYVLAAAPFEQSKDLLHVPWDRPWFWKRYEIYMSHFGVPFALSLIGAPFAVLAWRNERRCERVPIGAAALLALIIQLPIVLRPHGVYIISLPRYAMFFAAPTFAWSIGAALNALSRHTGRAFALLSGTFLAIFVSYAIEFAVRDAFAPLDYVLWARDHPGTRYIPFEGRLRSTSVVDAIAGPNDLIAFDGGWASWIQPIFGRKLSRPVFFIPPPGDGPVQLPPETEWVVIERAYRVIWGHPDMKTIADSLQRFGRNRPGPEDLRVYESLRLDSRFVLVWEDPSLNQAIFKRVHH